MEESENQTVPSEATAALLQKTIRRPCDRVRDRLDRAGGGVDPEHAAAGVADQQPTVEVDLDAERPAARVRDRVEPAPVVRDPEDAAVLGAGEDRALVGPVVSDHDVLGAGTRDRDHLEVHAANLARVARARRRVVGSAISVPTGPASHGASTVVQ